MDRRSRADAKGQAALDRAFEQENLFLVYQPIHDVRTGAVVAAEALVRQRRESGEEREASIITKAAEHGPEANLFLFDSVTMHMAYKAAVQWQKEFDVRLNVNLSPREFQEGNILPRLTKLVAGCGIDTRKINLEITEASHIRDLEEVTDVLNELKKLGIEVWLDDFGTGHSTIEQLLHFPIDGLKVPETFMAGVPRDATSTTISRNVIRLAHELGLRVIVEGVERDEQFEFLKETNCEYVQGFLFSKPMEIDAFEQCLHVMLRREDVEASRPPRS